MNRRLLELEDFESSRSQSVSERRLSYNFDPNEQVPSYESSQLLHRNLNTPIISRHASVVDNTRIAQLSTDLTQIRHSDDTDIRPPPPLVEEGADVGGGSTPSPPSASSFTQLDRRSLKRLGLKFLNARQHFLLACCRDLSLIPCFLGLIQSWKRVIYQEHTNIVTVGGQVFESFTGARNSEHFLTGVWCIVSGYLSYSVLDGLMVRWIVTYLTSAAIVRMLSMSMIIVTVEQYLVATFSAQGYSYGLHIWILISCGLTVLFIIQNFVTLNLDLKDGKVRARFFDFYKIAVFAVVPVGLASFITMIGLLRSLLILRLDLEVSGNPISM